jgi:chitinase domain-containing protein 1
MKVEAFEFLAILTLALLALTCATLNPSKNKKAKQKNVQEVKMNEGPVDKSVFERNLVETEPLASLILSEAHTYYKDTNLKNFNGTVLGYVTPWNSKGKKSILIIDNRLLTHFSHTQTSGYDIAKIFGRKFNIISPVWLQVLRKGDLNYEIAGTHDCDENWMRDVRRAGNGKIIPRILFEHFSDVDFSKLLTYQEEIKTVAKIIIESCKRYNFNGIVLEVWSQLSQRVDDHHLVNLVRTIARALKQAKLEFILVIPPSNRGPDLFSAKHFNDLWEDVSYFSLMTYDFSTYQRPGANSPLYWMKNVVHHICPDSTHHAAEKRAKILLGLNFYGYDFTPEGGEAVVGTSYLNLLKSVKGRLKLDERDQENFFEVKTSTGRHFVFYPTLYSVQARIDLARELKTGLSIWEIGQGLDYFYDLL